MKMMQQNKLACIQIKMYNIRAGALLVWAAYFISAHGKVVKYVSLYEAWQLKMWCSNDSCTLIALFPLTIVMEYKNCLGKKL